MADAVAEHARVDSEIAVATAREFAPDFKPSVLERFERIRVRDRYRTDISHHKPPLLHASTINSPSHQSIDNRPQSSTDSTPQKQATFPQTSVRRTSTLQKQASVDYSSMPNTHTNINSNMYSSQQQPHLNSPLNYGNSIVTNTQQQQQYQYHNADIGSSSYNNPNQNYSHLNQLSPNSQLNSSNVCNSSSQSPSQAYSSNINQSNQYMQQQQQQQPHTQNYSAYNTPSQSLNVMNQTYPNYNPVNQYDATTEQTQQAQTYDIADESHQQPPHHEAPGQPNLRRSSKQLNESTRPPHIGSFSQSSIDHFDHYKRPPSRDSSVDRYARAANRLGSRQPSVDRSAGINPPTSVTSPQQPNESILPDRNSRAGSAFRNTGPAVTPPTTTGNGAILTGKGATPRSGTPIYQISSAQPVYSSPNQPFEDVLLRQRTLGQDIIPSPREPKRTESLFLPPKPIGAGGAVGGPSKGKLKVSE